MKPWLAVGLLWFAGLLNYLDRQVIFSVFPLLKADLQLTDAQLGLAGAAFLWIYSLLSPVAGYAGDKFGHKRVIIASLLVWSVVTWATGQAANLTQLVAARAAMGIAEAFYLPAALALIASHHGERTRGLATGLHFSGIYLGVVLGGWGGGWLGAHYGWRFPFLFLGAIGVAYSLLLTALPATAAGVRTEPVPFLAAARQLLRTPGFPRITIVFGIFSVAGWLVAAWMPAFLYEKFGMSLAEAGFNATFYVQAASILGILVGGPIGDRWSARRMQALGLAIAAPFLFLAGFTALPVLVLVGLAVYGLGRGAYDANNMPVVCQLVPEELRATAYGFLNCAGTLVGGTVAFAAGTLKAAFGLSVMLELAGALLVVGAAVLLALQPRLNQFRRR
ncbi:MAG: MFS transporter [Bryobacteraceae bacterium]|nr:MFS transporter [Bryobacteraceae bacterium]